MLAPPEGLPDPALAVALERSWARTPASVRYRPVGWGSHHWDVTDTSGSRCFVTADELEKRRVEADEPLTEAFERLRASLATAAALRDSGRAFVVAPVPAVGGEPVVRVDGAFAVAVYPFVDGESFDWAEFVSAEQRRSVLHMLIGVHTAPAAVRRLARVDGFGLPQRGELEAVCDPAADCPGRGPYARRVRDLVREHAAPIRRLLGRYDDLVRQARVSGGLTPGASTMTSPGTC